MKARDMAHCAIFAAVLCLCAWIHVPAGDVAITLQTFAVALTLCLLGGKKGTLTVLVYLILGAVGLPVFSGFQGGIGILLGVTGGYIMGFLLWALLYWLLTSVTPACFRIPALVLGLTVCYAFGSVWFYGVYLRGGSSLGLGAVLLKCVVPYLLPDGIKLALAAFLAGRLKKVVY